ncbi:MAG TPA: transporter [Ignavibacteria bacterium]|jgi:hypothetical protein
MKTLITAIYIFFSLNLYSQKVEDIVTDRPDQTESATIVPENFIQLETGFELEKDKIPQSEPIKYTYATTTNSFSALLRYGLVKNLEIRLGIQYFWETINTISVFPQLEEYSEVIIKSKGIGPFLLGVKIKIMEEMEATPETSFLFHLTIPQDPYGPFQPRYVGANFRFAMAHTLSDRFSLSYNLGGEWNGDDPKATGIYTLSLGISLIKKLSMFVESYGFLPQKEIPDHRLDGGFTYLFAKNIQADVSGGVGITDKSPDYFIGAGFSIRLPG